MTAPRNHKGHFIKSAKTRKEIRMTLWLGIAIGIEATVISEMLIHWI